MKHRLAAHLYIAIYRVVSRFGPRVAFHPWVLRVQRALIAIVAPPIATFGDEQMLRMSREASLDRARGRGRYVR